MNKLNRLFAMLIAVLGVGTLSAQTDVTSTYLTNADFSSTDGWTENKSAEYRDCGSGNIGSSLGSYTASTTDDTHLSSERFFGFQCRWNGNFASYNQETTQELPAGVYSLNYDVENVNESTTAAAYNNLFYVKVGDKNFTDNSVEWMEGKSSWTPHSITFVVTEASKATVSLGYGTGTNNFATANTPVLYVSHLKLTYIPFTDVTEQSPVDLTSMASGNWLNSSGNTAGTTGTGACGGLEGVSEAYQWGDALPVAEGSLNKAVSNLPSGLYNIEIYCAASTTSGRDNVNYVVTDGDEQYVKLVVEGNEQAIPTYNRTSVDAVPSYTFNKVKVQDGTLNLFVNVNVKSPNWLMAKVKSITYLGPDKSVEEEAFNNNITALNELNTENVPTAFVAKINNLKTTYGNSNAASMVLSALIVANGEIRSVFDAYPSLETAYTELTEFVTLCTNHAKDSYSVVEEESTRSTFVSAISSANTNKDKAVTVGELTAVYNTLEAARQSYVVAAYPTEGNSFDMTFKIQNAAVASADGWTNASARINSSTDYTGAPDRFALDVGWWTQSIDINQVLTEMPNGTYKLSAVTRSDANSESYIYIKSGDKKITANLAKNGTSGGTLGNGWEQVTTEGFNLFDGTMTIGAYMHNPGTTFAAADNFKLYYYGKNLSMYEEVLGNSILEAKKVGELNDKIKELLTSEIKEAEDALADEDRTIGSLEKAIKELETLTDLAKSTVSAYSSINALVKTCNGYATNSVPATAGDLATFNAAIAKATADKETAATVDELNAVYSTLETARQTYVLKAYPTGNATFDMTFNIVNPTFNTDTKGWTVKNGKWHNNSGYDKVSGIAEIALWGDKSWDASISQNISLPNGKYKVKVAAQASAENTEMKLVANEVLANLTCIGDQKGNIAADGSVVELGSGVAGWQYMEVECLVLNGTLSIAANASATAEHCWANVDNFTLTLLRDLTDEERYEDAIATIAIFAVNKLATCVLTFDAELPTGVKAYTAGTLENNVLNLVEATELKAYTPYILYAETDYTGTLTGTMDKTAYKAVVDGTLAGAVEAQTITYGYALQNQPDKGGVGFYAVDTTNEQKVTIPAGKCWLDVQKDSTPAATARSISLRFPGNETAGMKAMEIPVLIENGEIYTIDGKRVENMQSGQIYIVGGQKIIKK